MPEGATGSEYREVLNDIDGRIVNFFRVLQDRDKLEQLQHKLNFTLYSQEEHREAWRVLNDEDASDVGRAWAWYLQTNASFGKQVNAGWATAVSSQNMAHTWLNNLQISGFYKRIMSTHISQEDAIKCLDRWSAPESFAFLDPPYLDTHQGHYGGYTEQHYRELIDFLDNEWLGGYILTNYEQEITPQGCERIEFDVSGSAEGRTRKGGMSRTDEYDDKTSKRKRKEIVWLRRPKCPPKQKIVDILAKEKFNCFLGE